MKFFTPSFTQIEYLMHGIYSFNFTQITFSSTSFEMAWKSFLSCENIFTDVVRLMATFYVAKKIASHIKQP